MFSAAGQILSGLNLESTQKIYSESQKADIYIRCAEAFLEVTGSPFPPCDDDMRPLVAGWRRE
jgi:hypothetical protein